MDAILTVRTDEALRGALRRRAAARGQTISDVVREILESALLERPFASRAGHLGGRAKRSAVDEDAWRRKLREGNRRR